MQGIKYCNHNYRHSSFHVLSISLYYLQNELVLKIYPTQLSCFRAFHELMGMHVVTFDYNLSMMFQSGNTFECLVQFFVCFFGSRQLCEPSCWQKITFLISFQCIQCFYEDNGSLCSKMLWLYEFMVLSN